MTDAVKEQLSACLDGELPEGELSLLLKRLQRDAQLGRSLGTYALIGEAIRGQKPRAASAGFADRIAAAVAVQPGSRQLVPRVSQATARWIRPAAGMAIAAGVAAIAVVSLQPPSIDTQQVAVTTDMTTADSAGVAPSYTVPTNVDPSAGSAFIPAARLTNYVVAHSEYSSPLGRRTVLSGVLSDDDDDNDSIDQNDEMNVSGAAGPQR
jgi:sigma-E factor negative regulatory protein RseA